MKETRSSSVNVEATASTLKKLKFYDDKYEFEMKPRAFSVQEPNGGLYHTQDKGINDFKSSLTLAPI